MNEFPEKIDLHMHTTVSDGTDLPTEILGNVIKAGIEFFSVTDHDAVEGSIQLKNILEDAAAADDPVDYLNKQGIVVNNNADVRLPGFITGIEFSCRDEEGKYHILGYAYDEKETHMISIVEKAHELRIRKVRDRLDFLNERFGITFCDSDIESLYRNSNPGKPHIAKLMIKNGIVDSIDDAMKNYLNKKKFPNDYIRPEQAIEAILDAGGIPVLAHPIFGDGDQMILGEEMEERLKRMISFGIQGVEAYYSGFSPKMINMMLELADQYNLYVTAGSDYHGSNKLILLGDNNLEGVSQGHPGVKRFLDRVL